MKDANNTSGLHKSGFLHLQPGQSNVAERGERHRDHSRILLVSAITDNLYRGLRMVPRYGLARCSVCSFGMKKKR